MRFHLYAQGSRVRLSDPTATLRNRPMRLLQHRGELGKMKAAPTACSFWRFMWDIWGKHNRYYPFCASAVTISLHGQVAGLMDEPLESPITEVVMALQRLNHRGFGEIPPFTWCLLGLGLHQVRGKESTVTSLCGTKSVFCLHWHSYLLTCQTWSVLKYWYWH